MLGKLKRNVGRQVRWWVEDGGRHVVGVAEQLFLGPRAILIASVVLDGVDVN